MKTKQFNLSSSAQKYLPFLCLIIIAGIFAIGFGNSLFTSRSLINELFTMILGTTGLTFLLSQGCLDFSIASNVALCCLVAAKVSQVSAYLSLPAAIITGIGVGLVIGFIHAFLKVDSFIVSLSVSFILGGVVDTILKMGPAGCRFEMLKWNSISLRIIVAVAVVVIGYIVFEKTRVGKEGKLVGSNPLFAQLCGINVRWVKIRGFMIMGGICGLVAFFSLIRSGTASTTTGTGFEVNSLNALLLGGMAITGGTTSRFRSAILGALILGILTVGMSLANVSSINQQMVEGFVYLFAICMTFDRKGMVVIK